MVGAVAALAVIPAVGFAQSGSHQRSRLSAPLRADGEPDYGKRREASRGFSLFGLADFASAEVKTAGPYAHATCNQGSFDCGWLWFPSGGLRFDITPSQVAAAYFAGIDLAWGAPPSQRAKIMAANPATAAGLANALGGGFTVRYTTATNGGDDLQPTDNQLGRYLSGIQSTNDRSCRDHNGDNGIIGAGNPLMPTSDCPVTWGTLGWQGRKPVSLDTYLAAVRESPSTFAFDFWTFADGEPDPGGRLDRQFGSYQTYGFFSDYSRDELCGTAQTRTYGNVIRAARNECPNVPPTKPGYPLGLEARLDAFSFGIPALRDVAWYQMTVVNNSADVYGTGVTYDSLYIGPMPVAYSNTQRNMVYYRPELGAMIHTPTCAHQPPYPAPNGICNGAVGVADLTLADVTPPTGFGAYVLGTAAMVILKSPLGDLRNKLFSRPTSPFFAERGRVNPAILDDTITFNTGHLCGFRACARTTFATDDRLEDHMQRQFGMLSSTERNVLGLRPLSELQNANSQILWHTFRSADFPAAPAIGTGPADFPQTGGFNRWVPGNWDWNDDGVQDTMYLDTCSGKVGGNGPGTYTSACVGLLSDTMPHTGGASRRFLNGYSNTAGVMSMGPLTLAPGDTISFVLAVTAKCCGADGDSAAIMRDVNAIIDHYMNFYLGPEPLPRDTIVAVDVVGGNQEQSQVTLYFTETAERAPDPFLLDQAAKLEQAARDTADTPSRRLAKLNPFLIDSLRAYGQQFGSDVVGFDPADTLAAIGAFDKLYIFKSCDLGVTFTNNANCTPSPATGGPFAALGWLPYATLERDPASGEVVNSFTDPNVNGGRNYTYVVVGATRGFNVLVANATQLGFQVNGTDTTFFCAAGCTVESIGLAPQLFNSLATSGPNAVTVYVPASMPAGGQRSAITVRTVSGPVPPSLVTVTPAATRPVAGTYSVTFYDSVLVTILDTLDADGRVRQSTRSVVRGYRGATATPAYDDTSSALGGVGLGGGTLRSQTQTSDGVGSPVARTSIYRFSGMVAIIEHQDTDQPVLVTQNLDATATPETFYSSSAFPGFRVAFAPVNALQFNAARGEVFVGPTGQQIAPLVRPYVRVATGDVALGDAAQGGLYQITWADRPFGAGETFRIGDNPQTLETQVVASLTQRAAADTADTSAAVAAALGVDQDDLVALKLPFRIVNSSFDNRPVTVASLRRSSNTLLLGAGQDTTTVSVPADVWLPGDELIFLEDTDGDGDVEVTFSSFVLGCTPSGQRITCNPIQSLTPGATGYISTLPGTVQSVLFNPALTTAQQFSFTVDPQRTAAELAAACANGGDATLCAAVRRGLRDVRVVPNPYSVFSQYTNPLNPADLTQPLLFTHVPASGTIRIWTVSGQFVQQLTWTAADLNETGDLVWDLRSREGNLIAGGLYMFTITGKDADGRDLGQHMGKFVVIR